MAAGMEACDGGDAMNPLSLWTYDLFFAAAVVYALAVGLAFGRRPGPAGLAAWLGLALNLGSMGMKLYASWPMQAPYMQPFWLPATTAAMGLWLLARDDRPAARALLGLAAGLALFTAFSPKDYYLPFPRSNTIFAHLFLAVDSAAKAFLLAGGAAAGLFLLASGDEDMQRGRRSLFASLIVWGFVLYSLGLFIAQTWSYLGWASPVVFNEYTMTSSMAAWFYYGCFLHLYLLKSWKARRRAWFALAGAPLLIYFNYLPETGQFKVPVFWP